MAAPRVTLQDLTERYQLSQDQLDKELSEEHLREASRIIDDHEVMGPELGLDEAEMIAINRDARTHETRKVAMLKIWKQKYAYKARYKQLIAALLRCNRAGHAQRVCVLLTQSKCKQGTVVQTYI